jgi:hypothetical protein
MAFERMRVEGARVYARAKGSARFLIQYGDEVEVASFPLKNIRYILAEYSRRKYPFPVKANSLVIQYHGKAADVGFRLCGQGRRDICGTGACHRADGAGEYA